jgi:hypothetical protein
VPARTHPLHLREDQARQVATPFQLDVEYGMNPARPPSQEESRVARPIEEAEPHPHRITALLIQFFTEHQHPCLEVDQPTVVVGRADHFEPAARALDIAPSCDAHQLAARSGRIADMLEDVRAEHEIERMIAERQCLDGATHERPAVGRCAQSPPDPFVIEADVCEVRREREWPEPASDIEYAIAGTDAEAIPPRHQASSIASLQKIVSANTRG